FAPIAVVHAYAQRPEQVDRMILACFVLGVSVRSAARHFAGRWMADYPRAIACLRDDLDELLTCWRYKSVTQRKTVRTTNAIERRFREARRRTRPMGIFPDRTDGSHPLSRSSPQGSNRSTCRAQKSERAKNSVVKGASHNAGRRKVAHSLGRKINRTA